MDAAERRVPLVAGSTADNSDDAAATADDAGAPPTDAAEFGGCCRCPFDRENIGISVLCDWSHSPNAESDITAVGGERVPLGGCSRRWWRACKGSPSLVNDAVVSGGPDTLETGPPWQFILTSRCACPCAVLFASPFPGGPLRQAPLCSQPKLQKGRGACGCCGIVARTVSHDNYDYRCRTAAADPYWYRRRYYYRCTAAGPRNITAGAAAATAGWKLQDISSGAMTRFRATEKGGKRTTEILFILVAPVLSRKSGTVSSVACLLHSSMVAAIRCSRQP